MTVNDQRALNPYLSEAPSGLRWLPDQTALCLHRRVSGRPAPQGSKNYLPNGGGRESSRYLPSWRADVREAFTVDTGNVPGSAPRRVFHGPTYVTLGFVLQRPKSLSRGRPTPAHLGKPDADKLARGVLDALTSAGVLQDDSQVVFLTASKRYAEPDEQPGCDVTVGPCALQ